MAFNFVKRPATGQEAAATADRQPMQTFADWGFSSRVLVYNLTVLA